MKISLCMFTIAGAAVQAAGAVTFSEHIAPMVYENCTGCHRPGEAGPFALTNYREVSKRSQLMLEVMEDRFMPPWKPVPGHGEFANERGLSDAQIALFKQWVEDGRPEGDASKMPEMPDFPKGWSLGEPDLVVKMKEGFTVPADGKDIYRNFVIPLDIPEDKWVKAVELRPTARSVVHHVLFYIDDWDLNWQGRYLFKNPIELPAGTVLKTELVYDNSAGNARNPFDPPQRIRWGRESTDEMGSVTLQVVAAKESEVAVLQQALRRNTGKKLITGGRQKRDSGTPGILRFLDKDKDGKVQESEAPARLKRAFVRLDKDQSGALEEGELGPVLQFLQNLRQQ